MNTNDIPIEVSQAAAALGRKGGKAGTGASKVRSPEHYQRLANDKKIAAAKRKKAARKKIKKTKAV